MQADHFRPVVVNAFPGPGHRVVGDAGEGLQGGLGPVLGLGIVDLHGDAWPAGHLAFKQVERIGRLTADGYCLIAAAQGHFFNAAAVIQLGNLKCHL